jgi:hypothetical protein
MKTLALSLVAAVFVAVGGAYACPLGTHPICTYSGGQSVCHCVP